MPRQVVISDASTIIGLNNIKSLDLLQKLYEKIEITTISLLIIDERKGRIRAKALGIKITGVIGIIIRAKNEGLIKSGKEKLDQLIDQGFRLSSRIYHLALSEMDER